MEARETINYRGGETAVGFQERVWRASGECPQTDRRIHTDGHRDTPAIIGAGASTVEAKADVELY